MKGLGYGTGESAVKGEGNKVLGVGYWVLVD
jgi:hypothetical protein